MKRTLTLLSAFALAISMLVVPAAAAPGGGQPVDQHCADHQTEVKVEVPDGWDFDIDGAYSETVSVWDTTTEEYVDVIVTVDGDSVTFELVDPDLTLVDASFCLKGGPNQTGPLDGTSGDTSSIPNRGGQTPDISYVVLYSVTTDEPEDPDEVAGEWCSPGFWRNSPVQAALAAELVDWDAIDGADIDNYAFILDNPQDPASTGELRHAIADALSAAAGLEWTIVDGERPQNTCPFAADASGDDDNKFQG